MTSRQEHYPQEGSDLHFLELAEGLEPPTCCLQDSCAADCATPAVGQGYRGQGGGGRPRRRRTSNRARAPATEALRLSTRPAMALRTSAPRLWGSSIPSMARKNGGSRPASGRASSSMRSIGSIGATTARIPW